MAGLESLARPAPALHAAQGPACRSAVLSRAPRRRPSPAGEQQAAQPSGGRKAAPTSSEDRAMAEADAELALRRSTRAGKPRTWGADWCASADVEQEDQEEEVAARWGPRACLPAVNPPGRCCCAAAAAHAASSLSRGLPLHSARPAS